MGNLFFFAILISPFLLLTTYILTENDKSLKKTFAAHTGVFILYMLFVANYSKLLTGHDEYGLGQLGLGIAFIVTHIIFGFLQGLYLHIKSKKLHE